MPAPRQEPQGFFMSGLDFLDRLSQPVKNSLVGNWGGAGRQTLDLLGDLVDAPLPGDWIPHVSQPEDFVTPSQIIGVNPETDPWTSRIADFVGDVGLNPSTYLGMGPLKGVVPALGKVAGKGADMVVSAADKLLPGTERAIENIGSGIRSTFDARRVSPIKQTILNTAKAAKQGESRSGLDAAKQALNGLNDQELTIIGDAFDNHKWMDGKLVGRLSDIDGATLADRIAAHPEVNPDRVSILTKAADDLAEIGRNQKGRANIFDQQSMKELSDEYLMRNYSGLKGQAEDELNDLAMGSASALKNRSLHSPEAIADFLEKNPGVTYERNALKRATMRAEQQGSLAQRAEIGKAILGEGYAHSDTEMRKLVSDTIKTFPPDEQAAVLDAWQGIPGRGTPMQWLAKANRLFKPAAVYGVAVPKIGSIVRNRISGVWQALSNPEARATVGESLKRLPSDLSDAVTQSLGLKSLQVGELTSKIDAIDQAFMASKGSAENAYKLLEAGGHNDVAALLKAGAMDGFVSSEELIKEMTRIGWKKSFTNIMNWPGRIFKGTEDRMRLGMGLDLLKSGKNPAEAAKIVRDSLYSYDAGSIANRRARDFIPFFQFGAKAIPQQAKFLAQNPGVAVGLAQFTGGDNSEPIYPWMEGKLNLPIGKDETGNSQYVSGFGLPFESLINVPNPSSDINSFGRDLERGVVGQLQPLLKTAYSVVSGEDPTFQTTYGSYDKMPIIGEAGDIGRQYNKISGTGLIQPLDSPFRFIDKLLDERRSVPVRALDTLTGANVVSVDPDRAIQQHLEQALKNNPDVKSYRGYYNQTGDEFTQNILSEYEAAKKRLKQKRDADSAESKISVNNPLSL